MLTVPVNVETVSISLRAVRPRGEVEGQVVYLTGFGCDRRLDNVLYRDLSLRVESAVTPTVRLHDDAGSGHEMTGRTSVQTVLVPYLDVAVSVTKVCPTVDLRVGPKTLMIERVILRSFPKDPLSTTWFEVSHGGARVRDDGAVIDGLDAASSVLVLVARMPIVSMVSQSTALWKT